MYICTYIPTINIYCQKHQSVIKLIGYLYLITMVCKPRFASQGAAPTFAVYAKFANITSVFLWFIFILIWSSK